MAAVDSLMLLDIDHPEVEVDNVDDAQDDAQDDVGDIHTLDDHGAEDNTGKDPEYLAA